jgi:hypothetical protein
MAVAVVAVVASVAGAAVVALLVDAALLVTFDDVVVAVVDEVDEVVAAASTATALPIAAKPATLTAPTIRRARRAGWGRFLRVGALAMDRSWRREL